ncbi:DUF3558 family protein [Actinokineospora pegani]|uniref:DUF3558 family protein n=1 Tax=Actinokineospora pegani TaxID=2654637 RepID=UPI0012EA9C7E|nr:DUF3558 family protein [Actinokineospora pegani]
MRRTLLTTTAAALILTACTSTTPGTPTPDRATTPTSTAQTTEPSQSSDTLADLDPCTLLTTEARTELKGETTPLEDELPSSRSCRWNTDDVLDGAKFGFGITIFPKLGVDKVNSYGPKTEITINGRRAVKATGAAGTVYSICFEITPTSRVDVSYAGGDGDPKWARVQRLAELVEPELP